MRIRCKRCRSLLPSRSKRDKDEYCSTTCCKLDHGIDNAAPPDKRFQRAVTVEQMPILPGSHVTRRQVGATSVRVR